MSYLPKRAVMCSIKNRLVKHGDGQYIIYEAYLGTDPFSKKPIRIASKSQKRLEKKIEEFFKKLTAGGDVAVLLTAYQCMDAKNAIDILLKNGIDISLTECARRVVDKAGDFKPCTTSVGEAYAHYLEAQKDNTDHQQRAVRTRVGKWVEVFGADRMLSDITAQEVADDLNSRLYNEKDTKTKTTYNNHLDYIKTFLNWCKNERSYIKENPIAGMSRKQKEWKAPEYLSAADTKRLFAALERNKTKAPADLADAILSFFCGMRQEEIMHVRLGESAVRISIEKKNIVVLKCKGSSKGVQPRSFTIPDTALAWMKSFDFMSAIRIRNMKFRNHLRKYAKETGIKNLPENVGRHTFITMHAAAYHDQNLLTNIAGNSDKVRSQHYNGLTFEDEGKAYFEILPSVSGAGESGS